MDVSVLMSGNEKLLVLKDQYVCDKVFLHAGVEVARPHFALPVLVLPVEAVEDHLVLRLRGRQVFFLHLLFDL